MKLGQIPSADAEEMKRKAASGEITKLKYCLYLKGMTVNELSRQSGISKRTLDEYVAGKRNINDIGFRKGLKIAWVLEADPFELADMSE